MTRDDCDCNTWLGSDIEYDDPPLQDPLHEIKATSNKTLEIQNWNLLFSKLLQLSNFNSFGLLMHMYDDSIEQEEFDFDTMETLQSQCGEKALLNIRRDTMYIFRA